MIRSRSKIKQIYVLILTLAAIFVSTPVKSVSDESYEKGLKAQQKSISYLSCELYGSSTQLDPKYTWQVPTADINKLQKTAYNDSLYYFGFEESD